MRIFVTGWSGLLGRSLVPRLGAGHEVEGCGLEDGDLLAPGLLDDRIRSFAPDAVVHLAAYTAVDECEAHPEAAFRVNAEGSRTVARAAAAAGARLVALSTDYVFDGALGRPYRETDAPNPLSVYGQSKLAGEEFVRQHPRSAVVRSAWLYGPTGKNFVDTILGLLDTREEVKVVTDQVGSPTYVPDLAQALARLIESGAEGLYHVVNAGEASWFDLAREAARLCGLDPDRVRPATTAEVPRPAPRPAYSVLNASRAVDVLGRPLRHWREALAEYLKTEYLQASPRRTTGGT